MSTPSPAPLRGFARPGAARAAALKAHAMRAISTWTPEQARLYARLGGRRSAERRAQRQRGQA